jgi:tetratricopeptide (TPR) repeat protein
MMARRFAAAVVVACGVALPAAAQTPHAVHDSADVQLHLLTRPATLRHGIGAVNQGAETTAPVAQRFYDQGLAYLHSYSWIEAARSFNEASRLDPASALVLVGLSIAYTQLNQGAAAEQALRSAIGLSSRSSAHDRMHVEVRVRQVAAHAVERDRPGFVAYRQSLDTALQRFPSDAELWLSRGMAEAANSADRGQSSPLSAIPFYEKALALAPRQFAAHHYLTHAFENAGRTAEALKHGTVYAKLAPDVPHARHMRGHALRRSGRAAEAVGEFEAADRLHVSQAAAERIPVALDWHYVHNLDLMGTSFMYLGRMQRAAEALRASFALPTTTLIQTFNKRQWPLFLRARGRHEEARGASAALIKHANPVIQAAGHIESGHAHLAGGNLAGAAAAANAAITALRAARVGAGLATVALETLQGEFYIRAGQRDKGRRLLEGVVAKASAEQGPDEWAQALLTFELTAKAARDAGDWELANAIARTMLQHHPSYAGAHYASGLVAAHKGDRVAARAAFARAEQHWSVADPDLTELEDIRRWQKANATTP